MGNASNVTSKLENTRYKIDNLAKIDKIDN